MVSVRWVAPILLLAMAIPGEAAKHKSSSTHPPRELHQVGDHWTPYNPPDPASYPANAKTYTIKRGDTLWALAQQFYGNAYLWPQLWESNTWVTDAHWIYPGDVLLVQGEAAAQAAAAETSGSSSSASSTTTTQVGSTAGSSTTSTTTNSTSAADQMAGRTSASTQSATSGFVEAEIPPPSTTPVALGAEADVYCYGYIGDPREPMPNYVSSFEDVETKYVVGAVRQDLGVSTGDLIYVTGGASTGLVAGDTYIAVEPGSMVAHPRDGHQIGRIYNYIGQIRILCVEDNRSRAIVTQSCAPILIGTRLKPLPQIPIPLARIPALPTFCEGSSGKTTGFIIAAQGYEDILGVGNLIMVDVGRDDQIQPGDFLTVYRNSPVPGQPRIVLGQIAILTTEGHTATARVTQMRYAITIGDRIELK